MKIGGNRIGSGRARMPATTPTQMWPKEKMEGCGEKRPQKCGSGGT